MFSFSVSHSGLAAALRPVSGFPGRRLLRRLRRFRDIPEDIAPDRLSAAIPVTSHVPLVPFERSSTRLCPCKIFLTRTRRLASGSKRGRKTLPPSFARSGTNNPAQVLALGPCPPLLSRFRVVGG